MEPTSTWAYKLQALAIELLELSASACEHLADLDRRDAPRGAKSGRERLEVLPVLCSRMSEALSTWAEEYEARATPDAPLIRMPHQHLNLLTVYVLLRGITTTLAMYLHAERSGTADEFLEREGEYGHFLVERVYGRPEVFARLMIAFVPFLSEIDDGRLEGMTTSTSPFEVNEAFATIPQIVLLASGGRLGEGLNFGHRLGGGDRWEPEWESVRSNAQFDRRFPMGPDSTTAPPHRDPSPPNVVVGGKSTGNFRRDNMTRRALTTWLALPRPLLPGAGVFIVLGERPLPDERREVRVATGFTDLPRFREELVLRSSLELIREWARIQPEPINRHPIRVTGLSPRHGRNHLPLTPAEQRQAHRERSRRLAREQRHAGNRRPRGGRR